MSSTNPFLEQLRLALNNFSDAAWLGNHSPLAAPYFLGSIAVQANAKTAVARGQLLQQTLRHAAETLWVGPLPHSSNTLIDHVNDARRKRGNKSPNY